MDFFYFNAEAVNKNDVVPLMRNTAVELRLGTSCMVFLGPLSACLFLFSVSFFSLSLSLSGQLFE